MRPQDEKGIETRRLLGPRLPRSEAARRVYDAPPPPGFRARRFPRAGRQHPTRDSPA